jgi:hypothetical protein
MEMEMENILDEKNKEIYNLQTELELLKNHITDKVYCPTPTNNDIYTYLNLVKQTTQLVPVPVAAPPPIYLNRKQRAQKYAYERAKDLSIEVVREREIEENKKRMREKANTKNMFFKIGAPPTLTFK